MAKVNIGDRFGRLTVICETKETKSIKNTCLKRYVCRCDCGKTKTVLSKNLTKSKKPTRSCGCIGVELLVKMNTTHGMKHTKLYEVHHHMKLRCLNPNDTSYKDYGGRGITICEEWMGKNGFKNFMEWAVKNGYKEGLTIDRINNEGNYSPENCRWTDVKTQARNRRTNLMLKYNGITKPCVEWAETFGIKPTTLYERIYRGWDVKTALETPVRERKKKGYLWLEERES